MFGEDEFEPDTLDFVEVEDDGISALNGLKDFTGVLLGAVKELFGFPS